MCVRQMRPPGRGDFWILKIAHAPSDKNLSKNGSVPLKGVAFVKDAFEKKIFWCRERFVGLAFRYRLDSEQSLRRGPMRLMLIVVTVAVAMLLV
jgi:hypothetical protein